VKIATSFIAYAALTLGLTLAPVIPAQAGDMYNFEEGILEIDVNELTNKSPDSMSFTKTLPLERYGATLRVSASYYRPDNYYSIEFVTSGAPSFDTEDLGQRGPLWPYSSVWNLRRLEQVIYAQGVGLDAMLRDLETKFNGDQGGVGFTSTGDVATGDLTITMRNK
jgi:hypothetical protein